MNRNEKKEQGTFSKVIILMIMIAIALLLILPILWLLSASLQGPGEIYKMPFSWIPEVFKFVNYPEAWKYGKLASAFISTTITSVLYIAIHLFVCTITGYVFAKFKFRFKGVCLALIMMTMLIPQEISFLPIYDIVKRLGLIDTYVGLGLPYYVSGVGVFLMIQFAKYVPDEILESARIDGCSSFKTFTRVAVPLMKSGISSLAILAFTFIWNEFTWARIVVNTDKRRTLSIALTMLAKASDQSTKIPELLAASVMSLIPIFIIFFIFQKQFIESVSSAGIKG